MNTFGILKTKIEKASVELYSKPEFKNFMENLKTFVLENRDMSELYFIYDDLSTKKGLSKDISDDYVNESIEYGQVLIESNEKNISRLDKWISSIISEDVNEYKDIDNTIYNNSIKNLESVLESKKNIKNLITEESKKEEKEKASVDVPLTTMVKIANNNLQKKISTIDESEQKELTSILSLDSETIKSEMDTLKEEIISNLKSNLNESKDSELSTKINDTIKKISDSKYDHYNLYKLRKLNNGLI